MVNLKGKTNMKVMRTSIWETNSSSMHSICVSIGDLKPFEMSGDGPIVLTGGEFGWEQETYRDFLTKANYCAQDNWVSGAGEEGTQDRGRLDMIKRVIKEFTGRDVEFDAASLDGGYIDHQSSGTSSEAFESDDTLKKFLFNPNSVLITDNDNH